MNGEQLDLLTLERELRDQGSDAAAAACDAWTVRAWSVLLMLADRRIPFTVDDLRDRVGDPPRPNAMGALTRHGARLGLIEQRGHRQSRRKGRHAGILRLWIGV